jgi:hypothetical protein
MEFLLDRFGYARARWVPQDEKGSGEWWRDTQFLLDQIERINREPQILPPPDDHVPWRQCFAGRSPPCTDQTALTSDLV